MRISEGRAKFELASNQRNLMPEAFLSGHEVVVWENGYPVRGYIDGVEVDYTLEDVSQFLEP